MQTFIGIIALIALIGIFIKEIWEVVLILGLIFVGVLIAVKLIDYLQISIPKRKKNATKKLLQTLLYTPIALTKLHPNFFLKC